MVRSRKQVHAVRETKLESHQNVPDDSAFGTSHSYLRLLLGVVYAGVGSRVPLTYNISEASPANEENHILLVRKRDEQLLAKLPVPSDIGAAFSTLCRSTEIPEECGSCLSHHFKLPDGSFDTSVVAKKPWADIKAQIASRKQEMGPLVWVNVVGESRPLLVPYCKAPFDRGSSYELVGAIFKEGDGKYYAGVRDDVGGWKCPVSEKPLKAFEVMAAVTTGGVSLLYHDKKRSTAPVQAGPDLGYFDLSPEEDDSLREFYDGRDNRGCSWSGFAADKLKPVVPEPLTKMQRIAKAMLQCNGDEGESGPFRLQKEEFDRLATLIGSSDGPLFVHRLLRESSRTSVEIRTRNGLIFETIGDHRIRTFCTICLKDAEAGFEPGGRRYCRFHFPPGTVKFAVYLAHPIRRRPDLRSSVEWSVVRDRVTKVKPSFGYTLDTAHLYFCNSLQETSSTFHALSVVNWLYETLSGRPTPKRRVWLDNEMRDLLTTNPTFYRQMFEDFSIKLGLSGGRRGVWRKEQALKFGFIFGAESNKLRKIYSIRFEKDRTRELVYVGKNSVLESVVRNRERKLHGPHLGNSVLALTPSLKMLNFLESSFQASVAVASLLGLKFQASQRNVVFQNCFVEPIAEKPVRADISEYLSEMLSEIVGFQVTLHLDADSDSVI